MNKKFKLVVFIMLTNVWFSISQNKVINVNVGKPGPAIQPTMWGVFFEDINFGADGGIYAELIKNRSFEFDDPMMGWKVETSGKIVQRTDESARHVQVLNRTDNPSNPRFVRISRDKASPDYDLINEGFKGIGIKKGLQYHFSLWTRSIGESGVSVKIRLINAEGKTIGESSVIPSGGDWKKMSADFVAAETEPGAKLKLTFEGNGLLDIDMVSLFPGDTWKQRPEGLRGDLVQLLADMKPGFLRFPGGCIVEGRELDTRYQWKKTVGAIEKREVNINRWNTEFKHRPTPDYFQSYGMGFFEYFQLAEDIGAEPLPIINCGMACQFNTAEVVPMESMDPYLQDALDLIEFANADVSTRWGKLRSDMGHPKPFNMKLLGIGNEQWGPQYVERYKVFAEAIRKQYPNIRLVTSVGPFPDGELYDFLNPTMRGLKADIIDEHYYKAPEWFLENAGRYDNYDRSGPKIFAGEYAAQSVATVSPENRNTWKCALAEAAFMTGLERNADVVWMASYAPLFAHVDAWQWTPDLIWFDNLSAYGTPNYYVQKLFATNRGSRLLPVLSNNSIIKGQEGIYASACLDTSTSEVIIKLVNSSGKMITRDVQFDGAKKLATKGKMTILNSDQLEETNSIAKPMQVSPREEAVELKGKKMIVSLPPYSFSVVRIKTL